MMGYGDLQILGVNTRAWSLETSDYTYRISFKKQGNKDSLSFYSRELILFAVWRQYQTCQSWAAGNYLVMAPFLARFCHTYFLDLQMLVKTIIFLTTGRVSAASDHSNYPLLVEFSKRSYFFSISDYSLHFRYNYFLFYFLFSFYFISFSMIRLQLEQKV